ncbi:MAG TPA: Ig-like domain-containing protein, partial [Bdellovibrionales bacterium]|nr:Ig-like domain-containing protein [Bdellovibrionales bacterium]
PVFINAYGTNSVDSGGNTGWNFAANQAPNAVADSFTANHHPTAPATVNLDVRANDSDSNGDFLTVTAVDDPANGTASIVTTGSATSISYTPDANFYGVESFSYTLSDGAATDTAVITVRVMTPYTWDGGGGDGLWTTGLNWHGNSVPGSTDLAIFDDTCTASCNAVVDANVTISGFILKRSGTSVTMNAGRTFTVGDSGWTQSAGTFNASDGAIAVTRAGALPGSFQISSTAVFNGGSAPITLTNVNLDMQGGTFNSTSNTLKLLRDNTQNTAIFTRSAVATFNHNSGLVQFVNSSLGSPTYGISLAGAVEFNDVSILSTANTILSTIYTVGGTDTMLVNGNLSISRTGTAYIVLNGGAVGVRGNLGADASISGGTATLAMIGTNNQTYQTAGGVLPRFRIDKPAGTLTPSGGTTTLTARSFYLADGSFTAPSSLLRIRPAGAGDTFSVAAGTTFNHSNSKLEFYSSASVNTTHPITLSEPVSAYDLEFTTSSVVAANITWNITGQFDAARHLTIRNNGGAGQASVTGGTITVGGDVTATAGASGLGTALIMSGNSVATLTEQLAAGYTGALTVNKVSPGTVSLGTAFATTGAFTLQNGTLDLSGFNLSAGSLTMNANAKLRLQGSETISSGANALDPTSIFEYYGTGSYTIAPLGLTRLIFDGTGTYNLASDTSTSGLTLTQGTLSTNGNDLTLFGDWVRTGGAFNQGATDLVAFVYNDTLNYNVYYDNTFTNLSVISNVAGSIMTFASSRTQTITGSLTMTSAAGQLALRASNGGTHWLINPPSDVAKRSLSNLDVRDSNNVNTAAGVPPLWAGPNSL